MQRLLQLGYYKALPSRHFQSMEEKQTRSKITIKLDALALPRTAN